MKYYLFIIMTLFLNIESQAKIFLVPSEGAGLSNYNHTCKTNNYYCMPKDFDKINQIDKPLFTKLTEDFNLDNESYNLSFFAKARTSIANEMLTLDDLELIIFMSEKISKQTKIKSHYNELNYFRSLYGHLKKITSENIVSDSSFEEKMIYIAGLKLVYTDKVITYIQKNLHSLFTQIVSYDSVIILNTNQKLVFLKGDCGQYAYWQPDNNNFEITFMPYFSQGCNFGEKIERKSESITYHWQEHKNKYLWGLAIVLGGLLINSKPIVIEY